MQAAVKSCILQDTISDTQGVAKGFEPATPHAFKVICDVAVADCLMMIIAKRIVCK